MPIKMIAPAAPATIPPIAPPESINPLSSDEGMADDEDDDEDLGEVAVDSTQKSLMMLFCASTATISEVANAVLACQTENRPAS